MRDVPRTLLLLLVWSVIIEFLTLRVVLRLGAVLPDQERWLVVYRLIEILGVTALNVATMSAAGLLVVAALTREWARLDGKLVGVALLAAGIVNLGPIIQLIVGLPPQAGVMHAATTMVAIIAIVASFRGELRTRVIISLVALSQMFALYDVVVDGLNGLGLETTVDSRLTVLAEGVAVLAALLLPWGFRVRPRRGDIVLGLVVGLVLLIPLAMRPWTISTMTMWTVSFGLYLPAPIYAVALGIAALTLRALWRRPNGRWEASGLILIMLGGLKLDITYFALLALTGLLVLSGMLQPRPSTMALRPDALERRRVASVPLLSARH